MLGRMFWRRQPGTHSWLPRLQSHRGFWVEGLQQNSFESIQQAYQKGYKIAEFDVRLTSDQIVVLFHDEKYKTDWLEKTLYEKFKQLIVPEYKQLARLEEVLLWMREEKKQNPQFDFKLNVEIKSKKIWAGRLEEKVCDLIQKYSLQEQVLISSFNPFTLFRVRIRIPDLRRALLVTLSEESNFLLNHLILNFLAQPDILHLRWNDMNEQWIRKIPSDVPIVLWTVNSLKDVNQWQTKIHGIISDEITPTEFEKWQKKD